MMNRIRRWPASRHILVLTVYTFLVVVMTWPIAGRLGRAFPASDGDAWVHLWTFNWVKEALQNGQNPYFTDLLFYPDGVSLLYHNIAWLHIASWLPLQVLVGPETAYSLIFLAVFVLNGFAAYLLARDITHSTPAAFVGGLVVAFWPYTLSHHNHPNLVLIAWVPLAILYLKRVFDRRRLRDAIFAAIFIALIGLTRWQLLVIGGSMIGFYVLYRLLADREVRTTRILIALAGIALLSVLIMAPLLSPVLVAQLSRENPEELFVAEEVAQTDLLAYLVPNRYHPLWGDSAFQLTENFKVSRVFVPFIGFTVLLLAVVGVISGWSRSGFWALMTILYILLALGPDLHVNGHVLDLPMPYDLVEDLFFVKIIRHPDRLNVVLSIPVAILTSLGLAALLQHTRTKRWSLALAALVAGLILAEYIVTYPTFPVYVPEWYRELAEEPGKFGLLGIPMTPRASPDKAYMYYQIRHEKPLVEGHVSRPPGETFAFIESIPLLRSLQPVDVMVPDPTISNVSEQLRQLAAANIHYLILHKRFLSDEDVAAWKAWLVQKPIHEDEELVVYRTGPRLGRDFSQEMGLYVNPAGQPGIGLVQAFVSPSQVAQGETVQVSIVWTAGSDIDQDYAFCLNVVGEDPESAQSQCRPLAPEWPTSRWQVSEIVSGNYALELSPYLASGDYAVTVSLVDSAGAAIGESAQIGRLALTAQTRNFFSPEPTVRTDLRWAGKLSLLGYDLSYPDQDSLAVSLDWQANSRMDKSYTTFLHLVDPATGQIVSQADVIPRGWSYPTNWWEQGEIVQDTVVLSLAGVPPGEYMLNIGWYDLQTGERLPVSAALDTSVTNDAVLLTTIQKDNQE